MSESHIDVSFTPNELATMVGLVANLPDDPESDGIVDTTIRHCRDIATKTLRMVAGRDN